MAHDGSYEVAWKGQAFPYLMHREGMGAPQSYGHHAPAAGGHAAPAHAAAPAGNGAAGVWDGPAPAGYAGTATAQAGAAASTASLVRADPDTILLSNGTRIPLLGLGTAGLESADSIKSALELGYRHVDCAEFYGNEPLVGEGLKDFLAEGRRAELYITSKVWNTHHHAADVRTACDTTLAALGCTYLDLFLMHWPEAWLPESTLEKPLPDTNVTLLETWNAMEALVDAGLVRSIGVSNFSLSQVEEVLAFARIKPVVNQIEMHPLMAQRKLMGVCFRKGVQCVAYSPLGSPGQLKANNLKELEVVQRVAKETGKSAAQVLLRWNVQRGIPVIPRAASRVHQEENKQSLLTWRISNEHKAMLDTLDSGCRFIDFTWKNWGNPEEGGAGKASLTPSLTQA